MIAFLVLLSLLRYRPLMPSYDNYRCHASRPPVLNPPGGCSWDSLVFQHCTLRGCLTCWGWTR